MEGGDQIVSKQVDERVVEMRFDNKQFESGVKDTMSTLDKFKQKLQLKDATKGLDGLEKAAKKVDFSNITKSANAVGDDVSKLTKEMKTAFGSFENFAYEAGFSVRDIWLKVGNVLEYQVAGRIIDIGKNLTKAFTIDPILTGFQEYETQINAVQTILANTESKGSTLQDVNAALNELNKYADMTIYNFTEMTRNIGTFTAAGVDLKTSVSAIKGIANLAAVSGSTSLQASTAMYQLSQALAAGKVQLMDWNSVVNAGMGGQVFQDALKETARVHGVAIDAMIKKRGSFRETLQDGWLTAEVLTETLSKFTGDLSEEQLKQMGYTEEQIAGIIKMGKTANDAATKVKTFTQLFDTLKEAAQSGWTRSWEILIGDFGEAKEFLTSISDSLSDIINKSADARNSVLSGGLSSGWKQLLNAGIADEEGYKETLKSVVSEHGTSIDEMIKAEQKLDESLSDTEAFQKVLKKGLAEGTLTSDMFSESVHKMAEKMSNMSAEELEAAGYTKDHVEQIKALSDGLKDGSISMDEFVKKMGRSSGRENLIEALWNSFDALLSVIKPIKEAFREIFPATTGEQLYSLTERIRDFTATLKLSDKQAANLKSTFKGVFSVINVGVTIIKSIIGGIATLIGKITGLSGDFLEISGSIGDWLSQMSKGITEANLFGKAIDKVVGFLGLAIDKFKEFTGAMKEKISASGFEWFFNLMNGIWDVIQRVGSAIGKVASAIGGAIANAFRNGDVKSLLDILNGGLFATILLGIKKYISGITEAFESPMKLVDNIKEVLGSVEDSLKSWQQNLQSGTIKNIAIAIGILAASLWVLSGIDADRLATSLGAITVLFGELLGAMALFNKIGGIGKGAVSSVISMIGMAAAVLVLASALKKLADLSWNQIAKGLTGVLGLMAILVGAAKVMSINSKKIQKGAMQMVIMAAALKILASVCGDLSKLSWNGLAKGVSGITAMLLAFAGFQALMKKIQPEKMLSSALSLILIGAAMKIFADVCADFGKMKWPDLGKAGAAIAGILVIAAGFGKLSSYAGKMMSSSIALVIIGAAMEIFADVANKFGQMKWEQLGKAGAAIGGILVLASGFVLLSGLASGMMKSVIALTIMAAAMEIFADISNKFGNMKWEQLAKAGAAIGGILALATGFALLAGLSKGILTSAAALLVMAAALGIFTPVMVTLGNMSWGEIVKGLVTIAGAFAIVGIAGAVLGPLVPSILALSGSITLLGIGCLAAGAGIMMFAAGFTALAAAGAAGATAFVAAITVIIVGILELIPSIVNELTAAVVAICNVIIQSAPAIGEAIKALVLTVIDVLVECIPALADGLFKMILGVLDALVKYTPQIVTKLFEILIGIAESAAAALGSIDPETFLKGIAAMVGLMAALNAMAALAGGAMIGVLAFGAVIVELAAVLAVIGGLAQIPGLEWLISEGGDFLQKIGTAIGQFIGGIIGGIAEGATSALPEVATNLSTFMSNLTPFIEGAKMLDESVLTNVQTLASIILTLTGAGILDAVTSWLTGGSSIVDFGQQLAAFGPFIKQFADSVAGIDVESVTAAANAGKMMAEMAKTLPNSGGVAGFFAGDNDMDDFAEQLTAFGKGIADFSSAVSGKVSGIDSSVASIKKLVTMLKNVSGTNTEAKTLGETSVNGFVKSFKDADANAKAAITKFLNGVASAVNNNKKTLNAKFVTVGKYLVDGFAKGISDNTFKAEAKAKAMANKAYEAARKALDEHSPSKKFMKMGAFVVAGFANGIAKNVGDANEASVKMANGVLESTMDALGIHSPSVVFDKKVGRYIVQGIAEGIKKDMSAEEAAEKKAQNIISAFQKAFDRIDREKSIKDSEFELWSKTDGKDASDAVKAERQIQKLTNDLYEDNQKVKFANSKFQQMVTTFGENSDDARKAYKELLNAQIQAADSATALIEANETNAQSIITNQEQAIDDWATINSNGLEILELMQANGTLIPDDVKDRQYLSVYKDIAEGKKTEWENAKKKYEDLLAKYGDMNHPLVRAAKIAVQNAEKDWRQALSNITDYEDSIVDREIKAAEDSMSHRDDVIRRWEALKGDDASEEERYAFYKNMYETDASDLWKIYRTQLKDYNEFVEDLAKKNGITIQEAKQTKEAADLWNNEFYPAYVDAEEGEKKVRDLAKDYLEQQKEDLKEQYETASDIADLKYQIWEKTTGRKATDAEKDNMKLAFLTEQLGAQAKLVEMAEEAWKNAKDDEKLKYEKEYWSAQLESANLQSEVLDIQEANTKRQERALDRQRNAQSEYADYIKKYEKYYLDHGMTMEELERDAKLVSGYDPSKVVNTAVNKTNTAIDNIKTNVSNLTKAVGEGIQNGVSEVTNNTTSMLNSCSKALVSEKSTWSEAGMTLVQSFINGIKSKMEEAVNTAAELAARTLETIQGIFNGDMDYKPTITPVLDMSNVSSGLNSWSPTWSAKRSLRLASSVSSSTANGFSSAPVSTQSSAPVYSFTQINNSPKALSSVEIYRQTNNMISRIGKKVT